MAQERTTVQVTALEHKSSGHSQSQSLRETCIREMMLRLEVDLGIHPDLQLRSCGPWSPHQPKVLGGESGVVWSGANKRTTSHDMGG